MHTIKVSELTGSALDWAVAKCEGYFETHGSPSNEVLYLSQHSFSPSTDWAQGGPIIERENILLNPQYPWWASTMRHIAALNTNSLIYTGPTPLVAAMRCYVASKLGDEVEIPKELLK